METAPFINIVGTECEPEVEEKFNKWYNGTHVPLLFKFKGMKAVTRYKLAGGKGEYPKYLAIYEFENRKAYDEYTTSPELAAAAQEMKETWQGKGFKATWRAQYEPVKTFKR